MLYGEYITNENDMQTMLFRYAVIVSAYGVKLKKDCTVKQLSDTTVNMLNVEEYSEKIERLSVLYGAGVISEDCFKTIVFNNPTEYLSDVVAAERRVCFDETKDLSEDRLPYQHIEEALMLCINTKKYNMQTISFDEAVDLIGKPHIKIVNGFVKCDKALMCFMCSVSEPFAYIENDKLRIEQNHENIQLILSDESLNISDDVIPFVVNMKNLINYLSVFDEPYGNEFIMYAIDEGISINENCIELYNNYLSEIKLTFYFNAFLRRRQVCGKLVNHFDYDVKAEDNNTQSANDFYSSKIKLSASSQVYSDGELLKAALDKYKNQKQLQEQMLVEVEHNNRTLLLLYAEDIFYPVDEEQYRRNLFDFDKIWSIIQLCSREHKIQKIGDTITIPNELFDEIAPDERGYASNLIKEQYLRIQRKRLSNPIVQTLNSLQSQAAANIKNDNKPTRKISDK